MIVRSGVRLGLGAAAGLGAGGALGRAGAAYLLERVHDGDVIGISAGQAILALVQAVESPRQFDVTVAPVLGGVQGVVTSDVNYLATELAGRLGGRAYQLHAPAFLETREQRDALQAMTPVREILDVARRATIALVGATILILLGAIPLQRAYAALDLNTLTLLFAMFGWNVALLYLGLGLSVAIVAGWVIGRLKMEAYLE